MKKYLLIPGHITSKYDNQLHYISYSQLISLYNLDPKQCVNGSSNLKGLNEESFIILGPRRNGNYSIKN